MPKIHPTLLPSDKPTVNPDVCEAQRKLNIYDRRERAAGRAGLSKAPLKEDCMFGLDTKSAVIDFQSQHGLVQDGKVGPLTWAELDRAARPPSAVGSAAMAPTEGAPRWSVAVEDLPDASGIAAFADGPDLAVQVGSVPAYEVRSSPDGEQLFFSVQAAPAGTIGKFFFEEFFPSVEGAPKSAPPGAVDIDITNADGTNTKLVNRFVYTAAVADGLEGLSQSVRAMAWEAVAMAATEESADARRDALLGTITPRVHAYQSMLGAIRDRIVASSSPEVDETPFRMHLAARSALLRDEVNDAAAGLLGVPELVVLDGQPFSGSDEEPELDTDARALMFTSTGNIVLATAVKPTGAPTGVHVALSAEFPYRWKNEAEEVAAMTGGTWNPSDKDFDAVISQDPSAKLFGCATVSEFIGPVTAQTAPVSRVDLFTHSKPDFIALAGKVDPATGNVGLGGSTGLELTPDYDAIDLNVVDAGGSLNKGLKVLRDDFRKHLASDAEIRVFGCHAGLGVLGHHLLSQIAKTFDARVSGFTSAIAYCPDFKGKKVTDRTKTDVGSCSAPKPGYGHLSPDIQIPKPGVAGRYP
jgi:hypothetical protein